MLRRKNNKTLASAQEAYNYALTLLNYRDYSLWEMQEKLKKCSAAPEDIKEAVDKLREYGFIDDKRYALRVYDGWAAKKYYGKGRLKNDLQKRNISDELIAEVTALAQESSEEERCRAAADTYLKKKKINSFEDAVKVKAGLGRFLFARGFAVDLIKKTMADKITYTADTTSDW